MPTITDPAPRRNALRASFEHFIDGIVDGTELDKLAELDAVVRTKVLALGEEVVANVLQLATLGALEFKQHRNMQRRTSLTGKPTTVRAPHFICPKCQTSLNLVRHAMQLDADGRKPRLASSPLSTAPSTPF